MNEQQNTNTSIERHPCAYVTKGAEKRYCQNISQLPVRQQQGCERVKCQSPWRVCIQCAREGVVVDPDEHLVVDPESGLCKEHYAAEYGNENLPVQTEEPTRIIRDWEDADTVEVRKIPIGEIRPDPEQPRQYFDQASLEALAQSIKQSGQIQPGIVREIEPDEDGRRFEIQDGERRWRACQIARLPYYRAIVKRVEDKGEQLLLSSIANFNREGHTDIETINMVNRLADEFGYTAQQIADALGKSKAWVDMRRRVRRLQPEVLTFLQPDEEGNQQLGLGAALLLLNLPRDLQIQQAEEIVARKMTHNEARFHTREVSQHAGVMRMGGPRGRRPSDDCKTVMLGINAVNKRLERLLGMPESTFTQMIRGQSSERVAQLEDEILKAQRQMHDLRKRLDASK